MCSGADVGPGRISPTFPKALFGEVPFPGSDVGRGGVQAPTVILCRHNADGGHGEDLESAHGYLPPTAARPCIAMGTFDKDKNPGLVVADLCVMAARFLYGIGKGEPADAPYPRDFEFLDTAVDNAPGKEEMDAADRGHGLMSVGEGSPNLPSTPSTASGSPEKIPRSSTKMRVATLAWLWKFADDADKLQAQFKHLLDLPAEVGVLHLCGCGICSNTGVGVRMLGCCEKTHLILGDQKLNGTHKTFHQMLRLIHTDDYLETVAIIQRARGGRGVF
ncbi:uncharacterized protein BDW47DRAFT_122193 [Aspergillus candidus]|uniref:Uncharacterized protein n=1 Tax=Aspergillus candidus TaxID=41067 RepID=A0A2I2FM84_ASPCN|nr:hypothetical protein BDW47DRAFT_122193 [Aspergillus candidus]PLB41739.1 hypothetical protein BDW47DRAFT_122193 [Aspergillus candidus]